jgi:hypothetical protein
MTINIAHDKDKENILYNPHFWIIIVITGLMIFVYDHLAVEEL